MLILAAQDGGGDPAKAFGTSRLRTAVYARYRVWRALRKQGFSFPGIGRVAGRHHASVIIGIRAIDKAEAALFAEITR